MEGEAHVGIDHSLGGSLSIDDWISRASKWEFQNQIPPLPLGL